MVNQKHASPAARLGGIVSVLAHVGYVARGLIYVVMGYLALRVSLGNGQGTSDQQGAIASLGNQVEGQVLLWLVLIGLVCYSAWGFYRAIANPFHSGKSLGGRVERVGYLASALGYAFLILPTYALISGGSRPVRNGAQGSQMQSIVAQVLAIPLGQVLVGIAGLAVIGIGIYQIIQALGKGFDQPLHLGKLTPVQVRSTKGLGRIGVAVRGIVFGMIGAFLLVAAVEANSSQAKGFDSSLTYLLQLPFGHLILAGAALGLMALGVYSFLVAIFLRLEKSY